jgi:hypothetical protein
MPLLEDVFYSIGQTKMFNTLNVWYIYHQLPLCEGDKVKITLCGIEQNGEDFLH